MAVVYWQGVGSTVSVGDFWGQGGNPDGYWSSEPADGDTAVIGRGSEVIAGDPTPLVELAELRIGHGFTGTIGSELATLVVKAYGPSGAFIINSRGDVHLTLTDDSALAKSGKLIVDVASGTVTIQDNRTLSQKPTSYTHTVEVIMRSSSSAVTIAQPSGGGQPNYTMVVATGPAGSQLTLVGATAADIYTDGCDVLGGTATNDWFLASGDIEPEGADSLILYSGTATPGLHGGGGDFGYLELNGGWLDLSAVESVTTFPGGWGDFETYMGKVSMEDAQPIVNRGVVSIDVVGGITLNIESAES
jgi:hypothetical protein